MATNKLNKQTQEELIELFKNCPAKQVSRYLRNMIFIYFRRENAGTPVDLDDFMEMITSLFVILDSIEDGQMTDEELQAALLKLYQILTAKKTGERFLELLRGFLLYGFNKSFPDYSKDIIDYMSIFYDTIKQSRVSTKTT